MLPSPTLEAMNLWLAAAGAEEEEEEPVPPPKPKGKQIFAMELLLFWSPEVAIELQRTFTSSSLRPPRPEEQMRDLYSGIRGASPLRLY